MVVPDGGGEHRGTDGRGGDAILVGFVAGVVAGMEVFGHGLDGEDANTRWEGPVEGSVKICGGDGCCEGEGCDLTEGVDSRVREAPALRQGPLPRGGVRG